MPLPQDNGEFDVTYEVPVDSSMLQIRLFLFDQPVGAAMYTVRVVRGTAPTHPRPPPTPSLTPATVRRSPSPSPLR